MTARRTGSTPGPGEAEEHRRALLGPVSVVTLTPREAEVLDLLPGLLTVADIARRLGVSAHTVRHHLKGLYRKLDVGNRRAAVDRALALGLLDAGPDTDGLALVRLGLSRVRPRQP